MAGAADPPSPSPYPLPGGERNNSGALPPPPGRGAGGEGRPASDIPFARFAPPATPSNPQSAIPTPQSEVPWYHHTWLLFLVLFGAAAATGLHWLWRTPKLSRGAKWFWTVVVSLYTAALLGGFAWVMLWCVKQFRAPLEFK